MNSPTIPIDWNSRILICMVHVNRNQLAQKNLDALFQQFDILLSKLDHTGTKIFMSEILGHEERVMIAKRLAAIILIQEGLSPYKTAQILKLSPSTAGKIAGGITSGTYTGTIALLHKNKRSYVNILKTIDSILHLNGILPHYTGLERYRNINQNYSNRLE